MRALPNHHRPGGAGLPHRRRSAPPARSGSRRGAGRDGRGGDREDPAGYTGTFGSIQWHFEHRTLEQHLPSLRVPTVLVLGADSPIPPEHGIATAALIPGARYTVEPGCGHFIWLERPGSVRRALASLGR